MELLGGLSLLDAIWAFTLLGSGVLYLWVYTSPSTLLRWNSNPWTFEFKRNLDLDFQAVNYAAYHCTAPGRVSHGSFILDAMAWLVVVLAWDKALLLPVLVALLYQSTRFPDRAVRVVSVLSWLALTAGAVALSTTLGMSLAYDLARVFLMVAAIVRVIGHAFETYPPFLATETDQFAPMSSIGFSPKLVPVGVLGYISEFSSGLPFRLVYVHFAYIAWRLGMISEQVLSWPACVEIGHKIQQRGWRAYGPMRELVTPHLPAARQQEVLAEAPAYPPQPGA